MAIDADHIAQWTEGTWLSRPLNSDLSGVCFDARLAQTGELFVALAGEERDGHDFVAQAHARGAAAALVERPVSSSLPQLLVEDTRQALVQMASAHRQTFSGACVGLPAVVEKLDQSDTRSSFAREWGSARDPR